MALFSKSKDDQGTLITATLVDWMHGHKTAELQKNVKKTVKKSLKTRLIRNNRINTFSVSSAELDSNPDAKQRDSAERRLRQVFSNYAKKINKIYRDNLQYNGDSEVYISAFEYLGMHEMTRQLKECQHARVDEVETIIEHIMAHASVSIWDLPGTDADRIVFSDLEATLDAEGPDMELGNMIDELLITALARNFLPFSRKLLDELERSLKRLDEILGDMNDVGVDLELEAMLRNFIGTISGLQESIKLFTRQIMRLSGLAVETKYELSKFPSKDLEQWLALDYDGIGTAAMKTLDRVSSLIQKIKPQLRSMLLEQGVYLSKHESRAYLLREFIETKALVTGIRQWVHRFQDLPSFTTLDDGIAFEEVEGEKYQPSQDKNILLEGQKLFKLYRRGDSTIYALRGVDIQIKQGEFLIIRGPSGSGKTTLLNLLAGLDDVGRGATFFKREDMMRMGDRKRTSLRRHNFSFIFQSYALIPHLSAYENAKIPLDLSRLSKDLRKGVIEMLEGVGIAEYAKHKPAMLSGGQMQRLGIARALVNRPAVIFADEPTGDLDVKTGIKVMELLKKFHEETGVTIVMVTHDSEMARYGTREVFLKDGQIVDAL